MEWIKAAIEEHIDEEGKIDLAKAIDSVKKEFPKEAVPKSVFNETSKDLKAANEVMNNLKKDNKDVEDLQSKIEAYESDIETLQAERLEERKTYSLRERLKDEGVKDVDYMLYKLGDVEADEEGNIKDLDNKVKDLREEYESHFPEQEEEVEEEPELDNKGFEVVDNGLESGVEPDSEATLTQQVEEAMGIKQE